MTWCIACITNPFLTPDSLDDRTGQAVAALCRRLGLKPQGHESAGEVRLTVLEIQKWLKPKPSTTTMMKTPFAAPEKANSPYSLPVRTIAHQQRAIRLGTVAPIIKRWTWCRTWIWRRSCFVRRILQRSAPMALLNALWRGHASAPAALKQGGPPITRPRSS